MMLRRIPGLLNQICQLQDIALLLVYLAIIYLRLEGGFSVAVVHSMIKLRFIILKVMNGLRNARCQLHVQYLPVLFLMVKYMFMEGHAQDIYFTIKNNT